MHMSVCRGRGSSNNGKERPNPAACQAGLFGNSGAAGTVTFCYSTHNMLLAPAPLPALLLLLLQALHGLLLLPPLLRCLLVQPHPCSVLCHASSLPLHSMQHSMPGSVGALTPVNGTLCLLATHTGC